MYELCGLTEEEAEEEEKIIKKYIKGEKISDIVEENGFDKAIFYDDNSKYLSKATREVKKRLPDLDWKPVKVQK